jgi:hypothetical protein
MIEFVKVGKRRFLMKWILAAGLFVALNSNAFAFRCPIIEIRNYKSYVLSKALVGNERGCTSWSDNTRTRKQVIRLALAECKRHFHKSCTVVKSAGY